MPLKLKLNTFQRKSKKQSLNTNQSKESGKEFNIYQLKLKLFTTQNETTTSHNQEKSSKEVTLNHINRPLTFQAKVELEPKQFTKLDTFHLDKPLMLPPDTNKEDILKADIKEDTFKEEATSTTTELPTLMELTLPEEVESDNKDRPYTPPLEPDKDKPSTELLVLTEDTLLEEVELDNKTIDCQYNFILSI